MASLGNKEIFAKNLKYYIERSGRDRRQLAEIWGFPYSTVTEWINARKYPRIDKIEIMANYFGIDMSDLIEEKEKPTENDGLSKSQHDLIEFAKELSEEEAAQLLQTVKLIVQGLRK